MARHENLSVGQLVMTPAARGSSLVSLSLTPASVGAATSATQNVTIPGIVVGDVVVPAADPITNATALVAARVASANTVALRFVNPTAGPLTPTAGAYTFLVVKTA
jgi:hypothetical protein